MRMRGSIRSFIHTRSEAMFERAISNVQEALDPMCRDMQVMLNDWRAATMEEMGIDYTNIFVGKTKDEEDLKVKIQTALQQAVE